MILQENLQDIARENGPLLWIVVATILPLARNYSTWQEFYARLYNPVITSRIYMQESGRIICQGVTTFRIGSYEQSGLASLNYADNSLLLKTIQML